MAFNKAKALKEAHKYVTHGKIARAIKQYQWIVEKDPGDLTLLNVIGELYAQDNNILVLSYIYQLPVGHGHPYGSNFGTVAQGSLGGWQIQGITTFQSGFPLGVYVSGDIANVGTGAQRPNLNGNPNNGPKTLQEFFNTAVFSPPAPGTFGNAGRNIVIGPGISEWDFSVFKSFQLPINEASKLEFRAEAFNIFNHANFTGVGSTFGTSTFGVITGAAEPRDVQLGLKLIF